MLPNSPPLQTFLIESARGLYPIVYVRGFAPTAAAREETFYDAYYGYAETAVEKRTSSQENGFQTPIVFEGQLIRFIKEYGYVDAVNGGLALALSNETGRSQNPTQSLWISRFYDTDVLSEKVRPIEEHAEALRELICKTIPNQLKKLKDVQVDLGPGDQDYKVILIAHSMGGLVCRCLIQNLFPEKGEDPKRWIHRFVTIGSPHGGIELSAVPDFLEELVIGKGNVLNAAIFREDRMRDYLKLTKKNTKGLRPHLQSLNGHFPEGRCLCLIGSDHDNYSGVKKITGGHSDGLVRQDRAYIKGAYWANVHRAHSGRRGIVNSFESYQNIRRFLFGDTKVRLWLENIDLQLDLPPDDIQEFYDIEFSLAVKGTGIFLHQRKQNPCENAQRSNREEFPLAKVHLHTGFLDTKLRSRGDAFSHFLLAFRIAQHRVREGFFFDEQYPERTIYSESLEVRINLAPPDSKDLPVVAFRWLSDTTQPDNEQSWTPASLGENGIFRFALRQANTLKPGGSICLKPVRWPDETTEQVNFDAAEDKALGSDAFEKPAKSKN